MISAHIVGEEKLVGKLRDITPTVRSALRRELRVMAVKFARESVRNKLDGQLLAVQTGHLARSVMASPDVIESGGSIYGAFGTNVGYGVAFETGDWAGVKRDTEAQKLKFEPVKGLGKKRPFLSPIIEENKGEIVQAMERILVESAREAMR